jgi:hypothetical protein
MKYKAVNREMITHTGNLNDKVLTVINNYGLGLDG